MDFTIFFAGVSAVVAIICANMGLISWIRTDMKSFEEEMRVDRKAFQALMHAETKDFHGRLCALEERSRK